MRHRMIIAALVATCLAACQQPAPAPQGKTTTDVNSAQAPTPPTAGEAQKPLGQFTVMGVLTTVRDAGYPVFAVTLTPEDGSAPVSALWYDAGGDVEVKVTPASESNPENWQGKRVALTYTRTASISMLDVQSGTKSLIQRSEGEEGPDLTAPDVKKVTGVLSSPIERTAGDLPDELSVKDAAGKTIAFEHFVTEAPLIAAAGKTVTLFYIDTARELVTEVKAMPATPARK